MKSKTIGLLAGITIVVILLAVFANREPSSSLPQSGQLVFPNLMSVVNEVNEVAIETKEQTVTLVRGEQTWGVKEKAELSRRCGKGESKRLLGWQIFVSMNQRLRILNCMNDLGYRTRIRKAPHLKR